jgi:flagellar basal-body rod modification protein FlgD
MSRINSALNLARPPETGDRTRDFKDLDVDQFLKLMVTELTNQDPLNPMDNTQLVEQIGQIRQITATNQLSETLAAVQAGQNLTTASSLIGKRIAALTDTSENISGVVDRVTVETDPSDDSKRIYRVHVGRHSVNLKNVREVKA